MQNILAHFIIGGLVILLACESELSGKFGLRFRWSFPWLCLRYGVMVAVFWLCAKVIT